MLFNDKEIFEKMNLLKGEIELLKKRLDEVISERDGMRALIASINEKVDRLVINNTTIIPKADTLLVKAEDKSKTTDSKEKKSGASKNKKKSDNSANS